MGACLATTIQFPHYAPRRMRCLLLFLALMALLYGAMAFAASANTTQAAPFIPPSMVSAMAQNNTATKPQPSTALIPSCPWQELEPGLTYASIPLQEPLQAQLEVLRFSPQYFDFKLFNTSEKKSPPQTLEQWAKAHNLVATINASMYLPDGSTSTGYMRNGEHINNKHISKAFGAFFLAQPKDANLASATLLEKNHPQFKKILSQYTVAVQNYRLISQKREVLWSKGGQEHAIAAVGMDEKGNILFLHCRQPIQAHALAQELLRLPLHISTVMYVEGGAQAGMYLYHNGRGTFWGGRHPADIFMGSVGVALPNILGVVRKSATK